MRRCATIAGLLALMLFVFTPKAHAGQVSIGVVIGAPPPPRVVYAPPPPPAPTYVWIPGYWYPVKNRYRWHEGYWTLPPYGGAVWVGPRYDGARYYEGYWEGPRGRFDHDHRWDKHHDRDGDRFRDRDDRDHDRGRHGRDRD